MRTGPMPANSTTRKPVNGPVIYPTSHLKARSRGYRTIVKYCYCRGMDADISHLASDGRQPSAAPH